MAEVVYLLCALTSIFCAVFLYRGYRLRRARLLFWSSLCFFGLAANNVLLLIDFVVLPSVSLGVLRALVALVSLAVLLYGLIWELK